MEKRDMNRDPITREPGSHPVGTGVGSAGGAAAGAALGTPFGPIGMLIGGAVGAVAGGAAGHAAGEAIDPTGEVEYWRSAYQTRPYYDKSSTWDDYEPAYRYGLESKTRLRDRNWDDRVEADLRAGWDKTKGKSRLTWERAKDAVKDSWNRTDRTYRTYEANDKYWRENYQKKNYFDSSMEFERDYQPAYRLGTFSRYRYTDRNWDPALESELQRDWDRVKGKSRLSWDTAKNAVRDSWHSVERAIPGDADRDGR